MKNNQRGYPTPKSSQDRGDRRDRDDNVRESGQRHGVYGRGGDDWRDMEVIPDVITKSLSKWMIFYCNYEIMVHIMSHLC